MKNSWLFKLLGAFLLVIAVGSLVTSLMTSRATFNAFNLYTSRNGQIWADRLAPDLAVFYQQQYSWDGVDVWLQENYLAQQPAEEPPEIALTETSTDNSAGTSTGVGQGQGQGQGQGHGLGTGPGKPPDDFSVMGVFGQRLILADSKGFVIYDSQDEYVGDHFSSSNLENGTAITSGDEQVGTLFITSSGNVDRDTPADEFITSVRRAVISSGIVSGIIALALGVFLFFQITAPLRKLRKAAVAIADGDLTHRVDIQGKDEFAELGKTFNGMAENLSQAEIQRQHLMADVAHELRTPLTAIQGIVEGMQDGVLPLDNEQLEALYDETTLLNRLIGDLRLLSLAEAHQLKLEQGPTDLVDLVDRVVERVQPGARSKEIEIIFDNKAGHMVLSLDPDRITQVLKNLINNALRYTPKGGSITVGILRDHQSLPILLSVTDTGRGIDPHDLPYVFDRFYRADKSRARVSGGSGLGLAIVKELVEAHGGVVSAESPVFEENGRAYGTRFNIRLPLYKS